MWRHILKRILDSMHFTPRIKTWNAFPFNPNLNLTLTVKFACHGVRIYILILHVYAQEHKQKRHFLSLQNGEKAQILCQIQMEIRVHACSSIYFFITVAFKPFLAMCMCFMNVSEGQLLSWMILDKWGSKCWQFNELQVSEHLFRGLTLSHRAFYMAPALPQWLTAPWPITTFTLLIHTRPHHNFSLCRWTLGTISHWKGLGKGQLPFCMAIKQYSMCQSFLLSHIPRDFLDTI